MSNVCQVAGRRPASGNSVSHSMRTTKRRFLPSTQAHRFWLASENRWIRLRVSARGLTTVDRQGIERVVRRLRAEGVRI